MSAPRQIADDIKPVSINFMNQSHTEGAGGFQVLMVSMVLHSSLLSDVLTSDCLTTSGIYLMIDCIEKCKEAFNSNHLRLLRLCSQIERLLYPGNAVMGLGNRA